MTKCSYTEALRETLREELERDPSVFLMGEDIAAYGGAFGVTRGLVDTFGPERILNTPISEPGFVGAAIGAAIAGSRPVVEIMFMDFITLAMDQLVNQAAKLHYVFGDQARCPMVLRTPAGAGRCYGATHSQSLEAWFLHSPGLKIAVPATPADARGLLLSAIRDDSPTLFFEHKMLYGCRGPVDLDDSTPLPFGKARHVCEGSDLTIIAWSWMSTIAEEAVAMLDDEGVEVDLLDLRTLNPIDWPAIMESVRETGRVMIVEEGCRTGGVSAEIGFRIFETLYDYLDAPITRVTSPDVPVPASPSLESAMLPNADKVADAARKLLEI